jgi:hypothetical protein
MSSYPTTSLQPGSTGSAVKQLQDYLVSQGYMTQAQVNTGYGTYGPQTTAAVKALQQKLGVDNSSGPGYWGPKTLAAVNGGGAPSNTQPTTTPVSPTTTQPNSYYQSTNGGQSQQQIDNQKLMDQYNQNNGGYTIAPDGTILPKNSTISPTDTKDTTGNTTVTPTLRPELVQGTPEYQAALDALSTAYYDVMQQQLTADTQSQQAAAESSWNQLKDYTTQMLGFNLSDDATKAWDQINGLKNQANAYSGGQNIAGSGIQQESIDDYLKSVRSTDAANRATSKNTIDKNQAAYYEQFATPAQVKTLVDSNPTLAQSYGLIPSDDIKNAMSYSTLKAKYPKMTDDEINQYISTVLDENGNRRSNLYQTYMTGKNNQADEGNVTPVYATYDPDTGKGIGEIISYKVTPSDTGMLDIGQAKQTYLNRNAPLGSPANTSGAPIIQSPNTSAITTTNASNASAAVTTPTNTSVNTSAASNAASNLGSSSSQNNNPPPSTYSNINNQMSTIENTAKNIPNLPSSVMDSVAALKKQVSAYLATMSGT